MKTVALDIGDRWTGIAISDILGITARPLETVEAKDLDSFLANLIKQEEIDTVVVGYPKTMRGTESDQTKKVVAQFEKLKVVFPNLAWVLWDERLTSKQASHLKKAVTKQEKRHSHSVAAALILTTYLDFKNLQSSLE